MVSRIQRPYMYGWMFTESRKYSVKTGFRTESSYPDKGSMVSTHGPNIKLLLAFA